MVVNTRKRFEVGQTERAQGGVGFGWSQGEGGGYRLIIKGPVPKEYVSRK